MSKPKDCEIIMIVDRSGSMASLVDDTIGSFNEFIKGQKEQPGEANATIVLFNQDVTTLYENAKLEDVLPLDNKQYNAYGVTALLDAVGHTVKSATKRHKGGKRPGKTVVCIITDGMENSSKEFSKAQVAELIKKCQTKHSWDFFFLGANIDSFTEAGGIGIASAAAVNYAPTAAGVKMAYSMVSGAVAMSRSSTGRTNTDDSWKVKS